MNRVMATCAGAAILLSGCGASTPKAPPTSTTRSSSTTSATTSTTSSPTTPKPKPALPPGPSAFLHFAKAATLGDKDLANATANQLLGIGNSLCGLFRTQTTSYGDVVDLTRKSAHSSNRDAEKFVHASVVNLCPENKKYLP